MDIHEQLSDNLPHVEYLMEIESAHRSDIVDVYKTELPNVEINSKLFYHLQKIVLLIITFVSSAVLVPPPDIPENSAISIFNKIVSIFCISPALFNSSIVPYIVIGTILFAMILGAIYVFIFGRRLRNDHVKYINILSLWLIFYKLVLPFPSIIIGYYVGYFFLILTNSLEAAPIVVFSFLTGFFWVWEVFSSITMYNDKPQPRKNDICQIHYSYAFFEKYIYVLPMVTTSFPWIAKTIFNSQYDPTVSFVFTFATSLISIVFVLVKKPYNNSAMNQFIIFISVARIPISILWIVEDNFPNSFGLFLILSIVFIFFSLLIIKAIASYFKNLCIRLPINNNEEEYEEEPAIPNNRPFPFYAFSFHIQELFLGIYIFLCLLLMMISNAFAAQRMPHSGLLPDALLERFNIANSIRSSSSFGSFQYSNLSVMFISITLIISVFKFTEYLNARKTIFIYGTLCLIRAISFAFTSLPAPCAGTANCPCSDPNTFKLYSENGPFKVAFGWLFGVGMFLSVPQCGDLIVSGHTIFLWLGAKTCADVINKAVIPPLNHLISGFINSLTFTAIIYIIISRNHYTVDVWFGFLFPELLWHLYSGFQIATALPPKPDDGLILKFIRWLEKRPIPLTQTRRLTTEL